MPRIMQYLIAITVIKIVNNYKLKTNSPKIGK